MTVPATAPDTVPAATATVEKTEEKAPIADTGNEAEKEAEEAEADKEE